METRRRSLIEHRRYFQHTGSPSAPRLNAISQMGFFCLMTRSTSRTRSDLSKETSGEALGSIYFTAFTHYVTALWYMQWRGMEENEESARRFWNSLHQLHTLNNLFSTLYNVQRTNRCIFKSRMVAPRISLVGTVVIETETHAGFYQSPPILLHGLV